MAKNPIENSWEKYGRLSEGHLHQLLYGTDKSKGKTAFERFYEKHAEQIKRQNGWSDVSQDRVRLWLQQQRSQLTEADALLTLERTFESDRDRRIAQTSERVRGDVAGVLGETVEGVSDWEQELASANKAEILSGEEELTSARLEAFRIGIREQIGRLDITERRQEHMTAFDLFEFYAKVLGLEVEDESGMAFRMAFVKRYRDFRDKDFLQGHFRAIAEDLKLGAGSMAAIQQRIASFLNESKKLQSSDIHTLLNENFPQLSVSREEVDTMLADRELKKLPNGMMAANSWILTNFLTELETAKLRRSCLVSDGEAASTERQISAAESQIAAVIKGSRVHHETSDRLISDIPDDVADKVIKVRLRNAVGARTVMMGSKTDALDQDERLKSELKSMKIKAGGAGKMRVRAFLDEAQAQAYSHLLRVHRISGDQVRTFRDLDPAHFDIFDMVLNPDLYLGRLPQPGVEDQDPAAKAEQERTLSDIRGHIDQLEKLVQAGMRVGGSWDKAACDLEIAEIDLLRKNYSVWADREPKEPKYHYRAVERDGERQKDFRVSQEKVSLELPLDLLRKYDNLTRDKRKLDQYSRTIDFFDTAGGFDNPLVLNQALELFYSDYNRLSGRHLSQSAELRKVMMVDHPLTAVMFNAATRQPRSKVGGGMYLHRQDGQPVTFKQRAGKLMEKARDFLRTRNFHGLKQLFEDGQEGERLYLDSAFFPRGNFASEDNTMRILSEARKDPAFDRLLLGSKGDEVEKMTAELAKDFSGKSNSLADDPQFVEAFSDYSSDPVEMDRRIADKRQEWLDYYEARYGHDEAGGCELGSRPDPKFSESALAAAAAAGAGGEEIDQELIKKLAS
ncbi:MAG: hypothetical protein Q8P95_05515, partial [bacterium]|nr:hypothetical protein [bacterium]